MAWQTVAEGSSWTDLVARGSGVDSTFADGEVGQIRVTGPFELPDWVLNAVRNGGEVAGVSWVDDPHMDGTTLVLTFKKQSPAIIAVLGALGGLALAMMGAFLIGIVAWQILRLEPEQFFQMASWVLWGGLALGALFLLGGFREPSYRGR